MYKSDYVVCSFISNVPFKTVDVTIIASAADFSKSYEHWFEITRNQSTYERRAECQKNARS